MKKEVLIKSYTLTSNDNLINIKMCDTILANDNSNHILGFFFRMGYMVAPMILIKENSIQFPRRNFEDIKNITDNSLKTIEKLAFYIFQTYKRNYE